MHVFEVAKAVFEAFELGLQFFDRHVGKRPLHQQPFPLLVSHLGTGSPFALSLPATFPLTEGLTAPLQRRREYPSFRLIAANT